MGKFGLILILALAAVLMVTGLVYKHAGYKICPACSAREYFERGLTYACNKDKDHRVTAIRFIKKAAEKGEFQAKLLLAELYLQEFPEGFVPVFKKQVACLASMVAPDRKRAVAYFSQVIKGLEKQKLVSSDLFFNIYLLYSNSILPSDKPVQAAQKWLLKAAEAGKHSAMVLLAKKADAQGDFALARKWFENASKDPTDWESALKMGDYYFYGKGVAVDYGQAEKWYQKAFESAQRLAATLESEQEKARTVMASKVRIDVLKKRLAEKNSKKGQIEYKLEGGVKEYKVFVKGPSKEFELAGQVVNKDGKIIAIMNEKLKFASKPEVMKNADLRSMVDGVKWVVKTYASHMAQEKAQNKGKNP